MHADSCEKWEGHDFLSCRNTVDPVSALPLKFALGTRRPSSTSQGKHMTVAGANKQGQRHDLPCRTPLGGAALRRCDGKT